jgi:hypothetical protein
MGSRETPAAGWIILPTVIVPTIASRALVPQAKNLDTASPPNL